MMSWACLDLLPFGSALAPFQVLLFGYCDTYIRRWFEPELLATLRVLTVGQMAFYMADPSALRKVLQNPSEALRGKLDSSALKSLKNVDSPETLVALMQALSEDLLKATGTTLRELEFILRGLYRLRV